MREKNALPLELQNIIGELDEKSRSVGLNPFTTIFELVDFKQLNEIAAFGGFPTRYPHWRWGMEYEKLSKSYTYGLSVIYEMVINNDPCYAYLLRANSLVAQKTVIAHVYGHSDFFKNNYWFCKSNRKMLNQMANHASVVRKLIDEVGQEEVENFIDICLSLENLIDIHSPFKSKPKKLTDEEKEQASKKHVTKIESKPYMDTYINPHDFLEKQKQKIIEQAEKMQSFPEEPTQDLLQFLGEYAPLTSWQRRVLAIIRDEAYYYAPQAQTKILNEGWATYWHSKMMTSIAPLDVSEIIDYCDQYAGVVANQPGHLNPYRLGVELLRHVEERWNRGKFGKEYMEIDDPKVRLEWGKDTGLGLKKLFEIRTLHNDITFIENFLDEDFCHKSKMFLYDFNPRTGKYVIANRDFSEVKRVILKQLTNIGNPIIKIVDGNFKNRGELLLHHYHDGDDLKYDYLLECLKSLYKLWTRPVHIETVVENAKRRVAFDGNTHSIEKI
ncbi:MAG: SpoVR family protein [Deltaproteobacteria bacterium]|nr:SpoVR family protein [Deltaproteobacteria bacterium]